MKEPPPPRPARPLNDPPKERSAGSTAETLKKDKVDEEKKSTGNGSASLLEAALSYAARGWPVFPSLADAKNKKPLTKHGFNDATTDPNQIRRWWRSYPNALISVPMGAASGMFAVDLDRKSDDCDGVATWERWVANHPTPETLSAVTPSTGQHRFFRFQSGIRTIGLNTLGPGIEIKGAGSAISLAPSRIPGYGAEVYQWINDVPIADAPPWLIEKIFAKRPPPNHSSPPQDLPQELIELVEADAGLGVSTEPDDDVSPARIKAALAVIDPDIERREWIAIGCALYKTRGDREGFELWDDWSSRGGKYDARGMDGQWRSIADGDGYAYNIGTLFHHANEADPSWWKNIESFEEEPPPQTDEKPQDEPGAGPQAEPGPTQKPRPGIPITLDEWLERELADPDFICGRWLTTTSRTLLTAPTGIGKSLWGMALCICVAAGRPFLHWTGVRPTRVLYIDGEMARRVTKKRLGDEVRRCGGIRPEGMYIFSHEDLSEFAPLNTKLGQTQIEYQIQRIGGVDLIVFDNIMSLIEGNQKDEDGWRITLPWVRSLSKRNIAQIWIHHTGHDESRSYGTKTREWQMDNTIHLEQIERPDADVSFRMTFRKAREREPTTRADFEDMEIALVNDAWRWTRVGGKTQGKVSPNGLKFYEALCYATADSGKAVYGCPAATLEAWRAGCVGRGLLDPEKENSARTLFNKYKLELITGNWVSADEKMAWTIAPNPTAVF